VESAIVAAKEASIRGGGGREGSRHFIKAGEGAVEPDAIE
jgi:hypothetical protein